MRITFPPLTNCFFSWWDCPLPSLDSSFPASTGDDRPSPRLFSVVQVALLPATSLFSPCFVVFPAYLPMLRTEAFLHPPVSRRIPFLFRGLKYRGLLPARILFSGTIRPWPMVQLPCPARRFIPSLSLLGVIYLKTGRERDMSCLESFTSLAPIYYPPSPP